MSTLASVQDVTNYLQETPDSSATNLALTLATSIIQNAARQHIFYVTDDTVTLRGGQNRLLLPQRPVVDVTAVSIDGRSLPSTAYALRDDELYLLPGFGEWWWASYGGQPWGYWPSAVQVTYTHGWQDGEIPTELRAVCISVAARAVSNPQGLREERMGSYGVQYAGAGDILVPGVSLSATEKQIVRDVTQRRRTTTQVF